MTYDKDLDGLGYWDFMSFDKGRICPKCTNKESE